MFHFTHTGVLRTVKYALKAMFQAHVALFPDVPTTPFAVIGTGSAVLRCFTPISRWQLPKFVKGRLSRHKTWSFTLQKAANRRLKGGLLQRIP